MNKLQTLVEALEALPDDKLMAGDYFSGERCCVVGLAAKVVGRECVDLLVNEEAAVGESGKPTEIFNLPKTQAKLIEHFKTSPDLWEFIQRINDGTDDDNRKERVLNKLREFA